MMGPVLTDEQLETLSAERDLLGEVAAGLERSEAPPEALRALAESIRQLDELFLVVVVGEFNAGKSALINALLGSAVLAVGVTPTTSNIHLVTWGEEHGREPLGEAGEKITAPVESLRRLTVVDTPGTNALDRSHEVLTAEFVPRADLVLFVTSADRPLSESERLFLESVHRWGKKVIFVLNKVDILRSDHEVAEILTYIRTHAGRLIGGEPQIFPVSALGAAEAQAAGDSRALAGTGLREVEAYLHDILASGESLHLKFSNPLGVAARLLTDSLHAVEARLELLGEDLRTIGDIERRTASWIEDVRREFELRLADIDNALHGMEIRGIEFFDETVRLGRLPKLFDKNQVGARFEHEVVGDVPGTVEAKVDSLIDWLVGAELQHWQWVVNHVNRRAAEHADRMVGEVEGRFEADRSHLLETVGKAARERLSSFDRQTEARRMSETVHRAVTGTALVEAGAVGLGAAVALLATSTAADVTGILAAGMMAALGLFILPHRRRRAKAELKHKIAAMRSDLMRALNDHFDREADRAQHRLEETIAPYTSFVRSESDRLQREREMLKGLGDRIRSMQKQVDAGV
jgi:small GTP-binding protein